MSNLFRQEAIESKTERLIGEVTIASQPRYKRYTLFTSTILLFVILIAYSTEYSKVKTVQGYIEPTSGEIKIYAPIDGRISNISISEDSLLEKGQLVAIIDSIYHSKDVSNVDQFISEKLSAQKQYIEQRIINQEQLNIEKRIIIQNQLDSLLIEIEKYEEKTSVEKHLLDMAEKKVSQAKKLRSLKHISLQEFEQISEKHAQQQLSYMSAMLELRTKKKQMQTMKGELNLLKITMASEINQLKEKLADINIQQASIQRESTSSLISPIDGRATSMNIKLHQEVKRGDLLFTVYPLEPKYEASILVPSRLYGDLKLNQEIMIKYSAFPFRRYGIYKGRIKELPKTITHHQDNSSPVYISEPFYRVKVAINDQSLSYNNETYHLTSGLVFNADIVLSKQPLIEALLFPIFESLDQS